MGLSASQGRMLLLTARKSDLEYRAQQISQKRLILSQQLEEIALEYENATSNRQMKIALYGQSDDSTVRTANLTYAALVSGSVSGDASKYSGIVANQTTMNYANAWASTSAYRLVAADGAIVVSSEDEIPLTYTESTPDVYDEDSKKDDDGIFTRTFEGNESKYFVATLNNEDGSKTALGALVSDEGEKTSSKSVLVFSNDGNAIIEVESNGKKTYFKKDGSEVSDANTSEYGNGKSGIFLANTEDDVPKSRVYTSIENTKDYTKEVGSDGVITLYDELGTPVQRYVVDPNLVTGTTDINGAKDGPNYIQDCLRNGKYLLQQGSVDKNLDIGYRWSNLSWDATANISDGYYTEDDDAAKAKYDRLQNQIQSQDKKLELELDQVETQRSAVTTEEESVKKVIDENIKGSFNAFA